MLALYSWVWLSEDLLECVLEELWPVGNGSAHRSSVDEIELRVVDPRIFDVVDFKIDIRMNTKQVNLNSHISVVNAHPQVRLDEAQIDADDLYICQTISYTMS